MPKCKYTSIGGQALIEGIMMKSPQKTAMGVRIPDGSIDITYFPQKSLKQKYKILAIPVIRGVVGFIESLTEGYKAMMLSAEKSGFADLQEEEKPKTKAEEKKQNAFFNAVMAVGSVLGIALSVVLFMFLPRLAVEGLEYLFSHTFSKLGRSCIEQLIKLSIFVLYVWLISFMKDIKRVFMYHGAEHKTIFCYEKGLELNVENVKKQKRLHPRCGTSFMILMILISVIISTAVQIIFPSVYNFKWLWVTVKILLIPLTCGVGYEVLKACGKYDNILTKIISAPGMWLQKITTKEPNADMIEIAIAALRACEPDVPDVERSVDNKERNSEDDDI